MITKRIRQNNTRNPENPSRRISRPAARHKILDLPTPSG
jgi:hypothetical protein